MTDDVTSAEEALEQARKQRPRETDETRNVRVHDAQEQLYRAQQREFKASIKRRARLAKVKR